VVIKFLWLILLGFSFSAACSNSTDYFRSKNSGYWSSTLNWESSTNNLSWSNADLIPTSAAAYISIQSGHSISINGNTSASTISIEGSGVLTFDGLGARSLTISNNLIINSPLAYFIVQAVGSFTNTIAINGNIENQGTFDLSRGTLTTVCDITFNKNGNQTVSGTGLLTRFNEITLDLGTSNSNILEISSANFSAPDGFLESASNKSNRLKNGTLKLSGTFVYSGSPFIRNTFNNMIVSTAGFWINNPNVTINAFNDTFDVTGKLQISQGSMTIGTTVGSCLKYATGSQIVIEGGNLYVISRIQGKTPATSTTSFNQSGGTITLMTSNLNSSTTAALDFTAVGSSFTMSGGTIVFQNENGTTNKDVNIKCSTNITGGTFQFGNSSTLNIPDGYLIQSDSYMPNLSIYSINVSGSYPILKLSKNTSIIGNLTINNSTTLDISKDGGTTNYDLNLSGNLSNNGSFTARNKNITFNGTNAQSINGSTISNFNNLTINNTSSSGISLLSPITINGILTLTDGNIYTSTINSITLNSTGSSTSGSENSYVDGPFTKIGNTAFIFPIGNNSKWRRIGISNLTGTETYTASYAWSSYSNTSSYNPEINPLGSVSRKEYWSLNKLGGAQANVQLFWENATQSSISDCATLKIAYRDNTNSYWEKANNSDNITTSGSCSGTNSGTISTTIPLTDFGIFTFGSSEFVSLPISLTSFNIIQKENAVEIKWETISEKNNDYFIVEKTKDGINYEFVSKIKAAGNHNGILHYETEDFRPYDGLSYYRLLQIDRDGKQISYPLQSISFKNKEVLDFQVYPNPISKKDDLHIEIKDQLNQEASITILNILGQPLKIENRNLKNQNEIINLNLDSELSNGIYIVQIKVNDSLYSKKIVLQD
jgi:hypothetical protein